MQRILSAIFDKRRDADAAIAELLLSGFPRGAIRLGLGSGAAADADPGAARSGLDDGAGGNFFHTLFGTDDSPWVGAIDGAVTHSHQVLTVVAPDLQEVERAAAIVGRYRPLDIDTTWTAGPLSQQQAEPPGRPHGGADCADGRVDLHAMHLASMRHHFESHYSKEGGAGSQGSDAAADDVVDDDAARAARQARLDAARFSGDEHYDEYAPAYLYGLDMATHEQHGGRAWNEAEPALRGEWEQRHPQSAWSKFKDAVRHGWERLRH